MMSPQHSMPTWIRLLLIDGTPDGIRIIEKSNWTGLAVVASRSNLVAALSRDELSRPGVYVLTGPGKSGSSRIYIGEADILRDRLKQHAMKKDFWTSFAAFTSSNEGLNKAHVRYLEASLIKLANSANQWEVENNTTPPLPPLSEADRADADWFLNEMLVIYPILGIDAFEAASKDVASQGPDEDYILSQRGAKAKGIEVPDGFVVKQGSCARIAEVNSIQAYLHDLRQQLIDRGVLKREGDYYVFTQDYRFASPSTAAGVLVGGPVNGRTAWKTAEGNTLKMIQDAMTEASG